ncbi:MAG: hypothetical protein Q9207_002756 [Kuettlingeria erythrocarpa]
MDLPSMLKTLRPTGIDSVDTSGIADTSSSGSFEAMVRDFQFPIPPRHLEPPSKSSRREGLSPLQRNNSWAAEIEPRNAVLGEALLNAPKTAETYFEEGSHGPNLKLENTRPLKSPTCFTSSDIRFETSNVDPNIAHDAKMRKLESTDQAATHQEGLWDDISVHDLAREYPGESGVMEKENSPGKEATYAADTSNGDSLHAESNDVFKRYRPAGKKKQPGHSFAIHVDEPDKTAHPQPLSAHPEKSPSSGPRPLRPINVNGSRATPAVRTPWHRQRYKNGQIESHRSSIYGPGALARKVQQEVMITVNIELDVLRREMSEKFAAQSRWFETELRKSQVWTLRVEDENRKLREELAKEKKRKVVVEREGPRTLC